MLNHVAMDIFIFVVAPLAVRLAKDRGDALRCVADVALVRDEALVEMLCKPLHERLAELDEFLFFFIKLIADDFKKIGFGL